MKLLNPTTSVTPINWDDTEYTLYLPMSSKNASAVSAFTSFKTGPVKSCESVAHGLGYKLVLNGKYWTQLERFIKIGTTNFGKKTVSFISEIDWFICTGTSKISFTALGHRLVNEEILGFKLGNSYVPGCNDFLTIKEDANLILFNESYRATIEASTLFPGCLYANQDKLINMLEEAFNNGDRPDLDTISFLKSETAKTFLLKLPKDLKLRIDSVNWHKLGVINCRILAAEARKVGINNYCKFSLPFNVFKTIEFIDDKSLLY